MKNYQNILVAVDGSAESRFAFIKALDIAAKNKSNLIITHIVDTPHLSTLERFDRSIITRAKKNGRELLRDHKKEAEQYGIERVTTVMEYGSPKSKIPKSCAKTYEADLIVSGATGLNAVERFLVGSVSESISRHATCDVIIVRNKEDNNILQSSSAV